MATMVWIYFKKK